MILEKPLILSIHTYLQVKSTIGTLLEIKARPDNPGPNTGMIAGISTASIIVLVAFVLLLFLFFTNRACFARKTSKTQVSKPSHEESQMQTADEERDIGQSIGVGADFGPTKPPRSGKGDFLSERVRGKSVSIL